MPIFRYVVTMIAVATIAVEVNHGQMLPSSGGFIGTRGKRDSLRDEWQQARRLYSPEWAMIDVADTCCWTAPFARHLRISGGFAGSRGKKVHICRPGVPEDPSNDGALLCDDIREAHPDTENREMPVQPSILHRGKLLDMYPYEGNRNPADDSDNINKKSTNGYSGLRGKKQISGYSGLRGKKMVNGYAGLRGKKMVNGYSGLRGKKMVNGYSGLRGKKMSDDFSDPTDNREINYISNYAGPRKKEINGYTGLRGKKDALKPPVLSGRDRFPMVTALVERRMIPSMYAKLRGKNAPIRYFGLRGKKADGHTHQRLPNYNM